jgi:hypothetical protein
MTSEQDLEKEGWESRGEFCEPRLSEFVQLYEEMGFEVKLVPLDPKNLPGCGTCFKQNIDKYRIIYVRRKEG